MLQVQPRTKAYIAVLLLLAVGSTIIALSQAGAVSQDVILVTVIASGCMAVSWLFPIHITARTKFYADVAVMVASLLLLPPGFAAAAVGSGTLTAHVLRRDARDWSQALFNTAEATLVALVGALLLTLAGWRSMQPTFADPRLFAAVLFAGLAIYALSVLLVSVVVALEDGEPVARRVKSVLTEDLRGEVAAHISLVAMGTLAAMVARTSPWGIVLVLVPIVATYSALKREVRLRYEAEQARIMSDAGLAEAQRLAHLGSWEWFPALDRWVWSDEVYRLLGVTPRSIVPSTRAFLGAIPETDRARVEQVLREARGNRNSFEIVHRVLRPNGPERFVRQRGSVRSSDDRRAGFLGTIQDVTDQVRAEEVMRQAKEDAQEAERAKTQLLTMASHDLRTPLTAIQGFLEIVVSDSTGQLSGDQREFLGIAYRNAVQLTDLVNDLLDLARIEARQLTLQISPVPLDAIAQDVLETVKPQAEAKGLMLHYAPGYAPAIPLADPARLRQVLLNLVTNAVKFTDGGSVTISTRQDGVSVAIEVTDTGIGIPPEVLPHVFEEFRQGGETARRRGGTGLGLAIVKRLIDLHQGTISVHSVEGEGSTFTLHLPAASGALIPKNSPRI